MANLRNGRYARIHLTCYSSRLRFVGRELPEEEARKYAETLNTLDPSNLVHRVVIEDSE